MKRVCQLTSENGNAILVMVRVAKALRRAGVPESEIDQYKKEAKEGDYNHLVIRSMQTLEQHNIDYE